tara:strand:+ start:92 stop:949 length:858 start_codon:yes stop_codon:yes gene_type:complete
MLALRWLVVGTAAATTLKDLCPNKHFEATLEDIDDEVLRGPPYDDVRDQLALRHATEGRKGLEIGGPTPLAANLYGLLASCDNLATFEDHFHGRPELIDGADFAPNGGAPIGKTLVGDASNLTNHVAEGSYEFLFASHVLEHTRDPLGALLSWDAALAPGGTLFLVLPWKADTFDHARAPNTLDQLAQKHVRRRTNGDDALMVDFEQSVRSIDVTRDWGFPPGSGAAELRERTLSSEKGMQMLHWHVFDFHLLKELYECLNYDVVVLDLLRPFHQVIVGTKRMSS